MNKKPRMPPGTHQQGEAPNMDVSTDRKCYSVFRAGIPKFNFGKLADSALFSCVLACLKYIHYLLKTAALSAKLNPPLANKVNKKQKSLGRKKPSKKKNLLSRQNHFFLRIWIYRNNCFHVPSPLCTICDSLMLDLR